MQYEKGLISVVIPTYRRSDMLTRAIDSVLGQTYTNVECIVVNDNIVGDEHSQVLYENLKVYEKDARFRFLEQEKHINGAAARNVGIRAAKGEYIAFLDDDDYWEKEKLQLQIDLLKTLDESWGAVGCLSKRLLNGELKLASLPYRTGNILMDILCRRTGLGTGAVLIRRTALDDVGYFDEALNRHQDLQLFACLAAKYKIGLVKKYLYNIESRDAQNRPDAQKLKAIKEAYFASINDIMQSLTPRQFKRVHIMHDFECAYVFLRCGQKKAGLKMMFGIFRSPVTLYLAAERTVIRFLSKRFRSFNEQKYTAK